MRLYFRICTWGTFVSPIFLPNPVGFSHIVRTSRIAFHVNEYWMSAGLVLQTGFILVVHLTLGEGKEWKKWGLIVWV